MRVVLPPITKGLLISWWLFWLLSLLTPDWVLPWGVALNSDLLSSPSLLRILGVAVYSLFHADFLHLFLNSIVFASLAQILETSLTRTLFVRLLVMSSIVPAILWLLLGLFAPGPQVVVGASGLVYALFGASLCIYPGLPINLIFIQLRLSVLAYILIAVSFASAVAQLFGYPSSTAHAVHFFGAVCGWFMLGGPQKMAFRQLPFVAKIKNRREAAQAKRRQQNQQRIDDILAKVSREGLASLSAAERKFLEQQSRKK